MQQPLKEKQTKSKPKTEKGKVVTGRCTFTKECKDKTEEGLCLWSKGCAYREDINIKAMKNAK